MSNCYEIIKKYAGKKLVREEGEGFIDLEDIYIGEDLEWLDITLFVGTGLFGVIKNKVYYFGKEIAKDKVEGRLIINYGKYANKKDEVERCVITNSGTVYAIGRKDKVLSHEDVIEGRFCGDSRKQFEMLD